MWGKKSQHAATERTAFKDYMKCAPQVQCVLLPWQLQILLFLGSAIFALEQFSCSIYICLPLGTCNHAVELNECQWDSYNFLKAACSVVNLLRNSRHLPEKCHIAMLCMHVTAMGVVKRYL